MTALAYADYEPISNQLVHFSVHESSESVRVFMPGTPDLRVEGEERFQVCLDTPVQGVIGLHGLIRCTTVVIQDCESK